MDHDRLAQALYESGMHAVLIAAVLEEMSELTATITVPGAGTTQPFGIHKGGKQGGTETPQVWKRFLAQILTTVVDGWDRHGYGLVDLDDDSRRVNHAI